MTSSCESFEVTEGTGLFAINLHCLRCEGGLVVSLLGGEYPHVGGVVLAAPRAVSREGARYEDLWDIPVPGHLDTIAAVPVARALCRQSGLPVTVSAGIHIDDATKEEIALLLNNCEKALKQLMQLLEESAENGKKQR